MRLLVEGDADGPPVVLTEEDHGELEHLREIQRFMEVSLAGGPVAKVREDDLVGSLQLDAPSDAHGMGDLARHWNGDGKVPGLLGEVEALLVSGREDQVVL